MGEGLIESGAYFKFWVREEVHVRERRLIEMGLNRAFTANSKPVFKIFIPFLRLSPSLPVFCSFP